MYEVLKGNKLFFGKYYFPHYFRKESPPFHINIVYQTTNNLCTVIQAPRGSAKSTVTTFLDAIHGIVFKKERFIIIVQDTYAKAAASLNSIKAEFRFNTKLMNDFGINMNRKDAEGDTIFTHPDGFSCRVLCKGADQLGGIRGEKHGAYRPTLILVDDLEDDELVKNPERRVELEKQFNEALKYAGEFGETRIVIVGTILHDDSLLAKMLSKDRYRKFKKLFYKGRYVENGEKISLWPQKWSVADLDEMEADDPEGFAKEIQGDPSSGSLETIRREDFRYWKFEEGNVVLFNDDGSVKARWGIKECKAAIAIDLAWETKQTSDYSAIMPGLCTPGNDILICEYINKKGLRPDELEEIIYELSDRYEKMTGKRVPIGFEKSKLEKVMKWFLKEAQRRRNKWLLLKDILWGSKDKVERILARVGNRYAQHAIYHKRGMGELENQLIRLRSVKHDDLCDTAGMLVELLAYAPNSSKKIKNTDAFEWWRKQAIDAKNVNKIKKNFIFGLKNKSHELPAKLSWR